MNSPAAQFTSGRIPPTILVVAVLLGWHFADEALTIRVALATILVVLAVAAVVAGRRRVIASTRRIRAEL